MTTFKSAGSTADDFTFWICPNTDNLCAYTKIKAKELAKFAEKLNLYNDAPIDSPGKEKYYLAKLDMDNRENRINISLPDSRGMVKLTLTSIFYDKISAAGGKIKHKAGKRIFHNGTPAETSKVTNILQLNKPAADPKPVTGAAAPLLAGVVFVTGKDNRFLSRLTEMEICLAASDINFAMVVQTLSEKRIPYNMNYHGLTVNGLKAILDVIALGGKFAGSDNIMDMAKGIYRAA